MWKGAKLTVPKPEQCRGIRAPIVKLSEEATMRQKGRLSSNVWLTHSGGASTRIDPAGLGRKQRGSMASGPCSTCLAGVHEVLSVLLSDPADTRCSSDDGSDTISVVDFDEQAADAAVRRRLGRVESMQLGLMK